MGIIGTSLTYVELFLKDFKDSTLCEKDFVGTGKRTMPARMIILAYFPKDAQTRSAPVHKLRLQKTVDKLL